MISPHLTLSATDATGIMGSGEGWLGGLSKGYGAWPVTSQSHETQQTSNKITTVSQPKPPISLRGTYAEDTCSRLSLVSLSYLCYRILSYHTSVLRIPSEVTI